jgi:hypothetical protein
MGSYCDLERALVEEFVASTKISEDWGKLRKKLKNSRSHGQEAHKCGDNVDMMIVGENKEECGRERF